MGLIEVLVRQSGKPSGVLGLIMIKIMNHLDSGLNNWILNKINDPKGLALDIGCGGGDYPLPCIKQGLIECIPLYQPLFYILYSL